MWDEAELPRLPNADRYRVVFHGTDVSEHPEDFDALAFIEDAAQRCEHLGIQGVLASDDYPGSIVAAAVAQRLGLPGPDPAAVLRCHHKYYSRLAQKECVAEAVPAFWLVDPGAIERHPIEFPAFVKPVKSFFSLFAERIDDLTQLKGLALRAHHHLNEFSRPLNELMDRYCNLPLGGGYLLAEEVLAGHQVTLEGCVYHGAVQVIGVTDSIFYPGTQSFQRFEYPSRIGTDIKQRMAQIAVRLIEAIGFDNALFNIEFFYDPESDRIWIIEINPRMCPQFADLMEKVNGVNTYEIALAIAAGDKPVIHRPDAPYRVAASFVLRLFEDRRVLSIPSPGDLDRLAELFPDARLKVLCRVGARLSEELQDGASFRYAVLNIGGDCREDLFGRFARAVALLPFEFVSLSG